DQTDTRTGEPGSLVATARSELVVERLRITAKAQRIEQGISRRIEGEPITRIGAVDSIPPITFADDIADVDRILPGCGRAESVIEIVDGEDVAHADPIVFLQLLLDVGVRANRSFAVAWRTIGVGSMAVEQVVNLDAEHDRQLALADYAG